MLNDKANKKQPVSFYLISDLHHYAPSLGIEGSAFEERYHSDQKCIAETGAILDAVIDKLLEDKKINIVLISGDLTCNGEKESHLDLIPKLRRLKNAGKRVIAITATHDYNDSPKRYKGDSVLSATPTTREELFNLYYEFGPDEALSIHRKSHSYAVKLAPGYRLLALNDDGNGRSFCGYFPEHLNWILEQIKAAHEAGDEVIAMTHHPVLPPTPIYPLISKRDMLGDYEKTSEILADSGVQFIFTGHTHMNNIAVKETAKGNIIYDINTASAVGYAGNIRKIELSENKMKVSSGFIDNFNWDLHGMTVNEYLQDHFEYLLNDIFNSMANDIPRLSKLAVGFSIEPSTVIKLRIPLTLLGKALQKMTFGNLAFILGIRKKIDPSVQNQLLKDLVLELIRNIYAGDEPYAPDTPLYQAFEAAINKLEPLIKKLKNGNKILHIANNIFLNGILFDAYPADNNALLPKKEFLP